MEVKTYTPDELGQYDAIITNTYVTPSLVPNTITDLTFSYENINSGQDSYIYSNSDRFVIVFSPYAYFRTNGGILTVSFPKGALIL